MSKLGMFAVVLALPVLSATGCNTSIDPTEATTAKQGALTLFRSVILRNAAGASVGSAIFTSTGSRVFVSGTLTFPGIRTGFHGMHIHANDNPANGDGCIADPAQPANTHFVSADGHYNPTALTHGQHVGDTPGVDVLPDGSAVITYLRNLDLDAVAGRALILHEGLDNFGNIPQAGGVNDYTPNSAGAVTTTQNTGNAGNRIACGIIQ